MLEVRFKSSLQYANTILALCGYKFSCIKNKQISPVVTPAPHLTVLPTQTPIQRWCNWYVAHFVLSALFLCLCYDEGRQKPDSFVKTTSPYCWKVHFAYNHAHLRRCFFDIHIRLTIVVSWSAFMKLNQFSPMCHSLPKTVNQAYIGSKQMYNIQLSIQLKQYFIWNYRHIPYSR